MCLHSSLFTSLNVTHRGSERRFLVGKKAPVQVDLLSGIVLVTQAWARAEGRGKGAKRRKPMQHLKAQDSQPEKILMTFPLAGGEHEAERDEGPEPEPVRVSLLSSRV